LHFSIRKEERQEGERSQEGENSQIGSLHDLHSLVLGLVLGESNALNGRAFPSGRLALEPKVLLVAPKYRRSRSATLLSRPRTNWDRPLPANIATGADAASGWRDDYISISGLSIETSA
jgi:hypothetical protein